MKFSFIPYLALLAAGSVGAADIVIIGEVHDNPAHHQLQAEKVAALQPKALVFEMLTAAQIDGEFLPQFNDSAGLEHYLKWDTSGWPDFWMYEPIFSAANDARIYGANVPRQQARAVFEDGLAQVFGADADAYGLTEQLPPKQQNEREAMQMKAHCDALPKDILPGMVEIQRLRDAVLARAVVRALKETGGPVAVITGNGHARRVWGVPSYLAKAVPGVSVHVIGQTEDDQPLDGGFDEVFSAPAVDRADPCAAFK